MPIQPEDTSDSPRETAAWRRRHAAWEPLIEAWETLEPTDAGTSDGRQLRGAPFGVKDVIDVAGLPTRCGWDGLADAPTAKTDAAVVAALRGAGAVPVGKTRSTPFAFVDPTTTRNPYDQTRTPGGSSSGSGAAVGAGVVPFALGTQTAGSLCRPAAYCGAFAYKPSLGALPMDGMQALAKSFDAIGVIAADFAWLRRVYDALAAAFGLPSGPDPERALRIGRLLAPEQSPDVALRSAMDDAAARIEAAGCHVRETTSPVSFSALIDDHRSIMLREAADALGPIVGDDLARLPPRLREGLEAGRDIDAQAAKAAECRVAKARETFWQAASMFDALLAYPTSGAAPKSLASTGDQRYLTPWTALGGPLVTLPCGLDPEGAPIAILVAAPPGEDGALMAAAARIAPLLPETPRPGGPSSRA